MKQTNESIRRNTFKTMYFESEMLIGEYQFPVVYSSKQKINCLKPFNVFMSLKDKKCGVHFFIDDYQFERLWANPTQYIEALKKAEVVLSPDFSMFIDMPRAVQIYNCYRNRAIAKYLQNAGVNIVPTVGWSDEDSFKWCFDGVGNGSAVAVSSNGCNSNKIARNAFIKGFNQMLQVINPCQIIFVGIVPEELLPNEKIYQFNSYGQNLK